MFPLLTLIRNHQVGRKGADKMKPKGWRGESRRHSLARKGVSTVIDGDRRFDVSNFVARGKYIPENIQKWERASNYMGEDYDDYYVVYTTSRDADLLGQSNWNAMLEKLENMDGVEVIRASHWAVGWVEFIIVHEDFEDALMEADNLIAQLNEYPVLDEEDWSQREFDDTIENIQIEGRIGEADARKVFSYLWEHDQREVEAVDGFGGYPSEESINKAMLYLMKKGDIVGEPFEWLDKKYGKNAVSHFKNQMSESDWNKVESEEKDWMEDAVKDIFKEKKDKLKLSQFDPKQTKLKASGVTSDVNQAKRRLIKQARERGISENFGQNQVRRLRDKYSDYQYGNEAERRKWREIEQFDDWAMNYTGD